MKKLLALGVAIALTGCTDINHDFVFHQELDNQVDQIATLRQTYKQQQLDRSYDVIRAKLTLSEQYERRGSPCVGKISTAYPSPEEQAALRRWIAQRGEFLVQLAVMAKPVQDIPDRLKNMSENFDRVKFEEEAKITMKLEDLAQGRITYCQFAEASKAIDLEAGKIAEGFRNQIQEEALLDEKRRIGYPTLHLSYTSATPGSP